MFEKVSTLLDCSTISLNDYVAVDDDVSAALILTEKRILEIVHITNDSKHEDFEDESTSGATRMGPEVLCNTYFLRILFPLFHLKNLQLGDRNFVILN